MPDEAELKGQLTKLGSELERRSRHAKRLDRYYDDSEGECPLPRAIHEARVTKAYRLLMPMAQAPWGSLIVNSVQDRLEVSGIQDVKGNETAADAVWGSWQDNQMDAESKLAINAALVSGRAFATVWPENGGPPQITLDSAEQMIVQYREGSRRHRVAALRYWMDGDIPHANLYRPDGIYKFKGPKNSGAFSGTQWERREVLGEDWPLQNPYKVVPVVELAVNRRLKPGSFGHARGEFAHCVGLIDRINLLTFLGLVVAFYMGFPLRGVIGEQMRREVLKDDDGNTLFDAQGKERTKVVPPFDAHAAGIFQLEDPQAKLAEFAAADRKNLSIFAELSQLSAVTHTPRHYFPLEQAMANLSADAIRADEGALHAKVRGLHKPSLGEGWEEVLRLTGLMLDTPVMLSPRAELQWADHESRSLAERADAASKLKDVLPPMAVAELALSATKEQIARWESQAASGALTQLMAAANTPPAPSVA